MRKQFFLFTLLLCLCANVAFATDWIGEEITSGSSYYLYNPNAALFLNNSNNVASTPSTLWIFTLSDSKYTINNGSDYVWVDIGKNNNNKYDHSSASSSGPASGTGASSNLIYTKNNNNKYQFYFVRELGKYWFSMQYGYAYVVINNNTLTTIGGEGQSPSSTDAKTYWQVISTIQYNSTLPYYYKAIAANKTGDTNGNAYVTFTAADKSSTTSTQVTMNSTDPSAPSLSATSYAITAYYRAVPNTGKVFVGWSTTADGSSIIAGAGAEYERTITSYSHDSENPQTETLYAVFGDKFERNINYTPSAIYVDSEKTNAFNISDCGGVNTLTNSSDNDFYYTITTNSISSEITGCDEDHTTDVITYDVENNKLIAWNAGTATITFVQKATATTLSNGDGQSFDITVSKRDNPISISGAGSFNDGTSAYTTSLYYSSSDAITITFANKLSNPTVSQTTGETYATYSGTGANGTISTTFNAGTATWDVSQPENYKYLAGSATITATVAALNETCYLVNDANVYNVKDEVKSFEWSDVIAVTGAISFEANRPTGSTGYIDLYKKTEEGEWTKFDNIDGSLSSSYKSFPEEIEATCKGIRFDGKNWVGAKNIRNVKVTRLLFLTPSVPSIDFGKTLQNTLLTETFTLDWSCSQNDGDITLISDDSHFTLSTNNESFSPSVTIANAYQETGRSGRTTIYVKYVSAETGNHGGTITIYNKSRKSTVTLAGETQGKYDLLISGANIAANTLYVGGELASGYTFTFNGSEVPVETPTEGEGSSHFYYVLTNNTVETDATWPNNEYSNKIVEYDAANNKFVAYNAGTATITFYETGNSTINARDPQAYTITVSKVAPEFTQQLSSVAINHNVTLGNFASSTSDGVLSWSLPSNIYATMTNNEIVTVKEGNITVTVSQATTYKYAAAETTMDLEITAISGAEWLEKPAPAAGSYYLFNVGANQFIKMNNGYPSTTEEVGDATLFTITGTSATDITYTKNTTTYYLFQSAGTYSESPSTMPTDHKWNISVYNTQYYQIYSNNKNGGNDNNGNRYITAKGSNSECSCSKNNSEYNTANGSWIFVTEGEYAAFRAYLAATEMLGADNHLSESLKGPLATAVANKTKGDDNYATWTSTLTSLTEACSDYVDHLEDEIELHRDASNNGYYMFYNAKYDARLGDDVQAYTAAWNGESIVLTAVPNQVIPAGDVALVYSNSKSEFYYALETATAESISGNAFEHHTSTYESDEDHVDYILTAQKDVDVITSYAFCKFVGDNHSLLRDRNVLVWHKSGAAAPTIINIETEENIATALVPVYEAPATTEQKANGKKILIEGRLYIQQGDNLYDALGRKVQ